MTSRPRPRSAPIRRALGREDGLAAVELALALPFLALLLVGLVDIGTVVYQQMQLAAAARAGAELGFLGGTDPDRVARSGPRSRPRRRRLRVARGRSRSSCAANVPAGSR